MSKIKVHYWDELMEAQEKEEKEGQNAGDSGRN
jgi:hypothetical protein